MMRNIKVIVLSLIMITVLAGCTSNTIPELRGFYQSEMVNGYVVQLSVQKEDNSFIEYIDNREVNRGTYEKAENDKYLMTGDKQSFEITLNDDKSFAIIVKKINDGKPIKMLNSGRTPVYFPAIFDDVNEYKALLDE